MHRSLALLAACLLLAPTVAWAEEPARAAPASRGGRPADVLPRGVLVQVEAAAVAAPTPAVPTPTAVPAMPTVEPAPEPAPPSPDESAGPVERWRALVASYPDWDPNVALAVIACESGGDPGAVNRSSGASGLFQLLGWEWLAEYLGGFGASVFDPSVNVAAAHWLWAQSGGFGVHWAASRGCWAT